MIPFEKTEQFTQLLRSSSIYCDINQSVSLSRPLLMIYWSAAAAAASVYENI